MRQPQRSWRHLTGAALALAALTGTTDLTAQPADDSSAAEEQPDPGTDSGNGEPEYDEKGRQVQKPKAPPKRQKITLPEPLNYVPPVHPEAAKEAGIEGAVVLKLTIDMDGNVVGAEVFTRGGHGFDEAAIEAAKQLKFSPARRANGNPFKAIIKYRYEFKLEAPEEPEVVEPETGSLRGKVLIQGLEAPLAGAVLLIVDETDQVVEVRTGADGSFALPELKPGSYSVSISAEGYEELSVTESLGAGDELTATYRLNAKTTGGVIEVFVRGEKPPREVTRRTIERREIERIPGTSGDALRSIESLPGVARPPGLAGILLVRGSSPGDTQTFFDGIYVPIIYHFGGLSSVVPTELLSKIDFYPGNFSARYGRAMGGIIDAGIRSPKSDGYHGLAQLDLMDARLMLEGPIPLLDDWTFAAAGRRSHLDAWLGPVLEEAGASVTQAPRYYDYQFMVERKWDDTARFRTSFYGSDDGMELLLNEPQPGEPALAGNIGFSTAFSRLQLAYEHQYSPDDEVEVQFALGRDALAFSFSSLFFELEIFEIMARAEYTRRLAKNAVMHLGFDGGWGYADVGAQLPAPQRPGQPANQPFSTRNTITIDQEQGFANTAGYLEMELTPISRWRIVPGLRVDYSDFNTDVTVDPRFNTRFDIIEGFPRTTAKAGVGMYHQPPQYQQAIPPLGNEGIGANRAMHYGLGVEQEITKQLEASLEGFYKDLDNLVVAVPSASGANVVYTNQGVGNVLGGELMVKYKPDDRFFGWLAYTLSRSVRQNTPDEEEVHVSFDQTHVLTLLGSYRLGHGWEFGARFRLVSGNLVDPNVCDSAEDDCDPNRVNALYHAGTGAYTPIRFGADNSERLPLYHQLDIRIDKAFQFESWKLSAYLDVQNAYNNQNVEGIMYDYRFSSRQFFTGVPILPSIGLRGEF
ncbi:MAG: TonB-dependent receptor [Deltaproteobacteria bacterium]|nr:TonB-dependent receptor [Deltaproteobacteria bacterium]